MISDIGKKIRRLHRTVLGINARNLACIYPLNPRCHFPRADNKLQGKLLLAKHEIPHPKTLAVYRGHGDMKRLEADMGSVDGFALKPAQGYGGRGILIIRRGADDTWVSADGHQIDIDTIRVHIYNILAGHFSMERVADTAFLEELVLPEETLGSISFQGLPDIRIILYKDTPVMAMVRVPTRRSGGRANLHQGALGLGVNMQTGVTTHAILKNRSVTVAPELNKPLVGIQVPHWDRMVDMAVKVSRVFGLGYIGIDVAIDHIGDPLVIEVNARPGLNIQLANAQGLVARIPWEDMK
jgi:alpha-L-glutamate ligase-like protein